ncbi:MAG: DUF3459 domain-containing protein [Phycisphaerales bacterium]|nr:DUF3459 domain-containing protein [Phycisphaerales bacterium]
MRHARGLLILLVGLLAGLVVRHASGQPSARTPGVRDDVLYQIMPIAWRHAGGADADPSRPGNFEGMVESLDYLRELGVTGTWLTPVFPSPAYHGYQHVEADRVNPRLGDEAGFLRFVRGSHSAGMKVFIDIVVYGISDASQTARLARERPDDDRWLAAGTGPDTVHNGYAYRTWSGDRVGFVRWDLRHPAPRGMVIQWAAKWLDPNADGDRSDGVDGFRLDQVWPVFPHGPGGWGYSDDVFWAEWYATLRAIKPDLFCVAEQARWESHGDDLLRHHDAAFTKPFLFAARRALRSEHAADLYTSMDATLAALAPHAASGRTFLCTLGDHDVDRLASAIGADTPETIGRARAAAAVLLLQPFPPVIYYGDEIGMLGREAHYGGDANDIHRREPMKWLRVAGPPMSHYTVLHHKAHASLASADADGRSVEEQVGVPGSLLETYRTLIHLRRESPALRHGGYTPVITDQPGVWCFDRDLKGASLRVAINLTGRRLVCTPGVGPAIEIEPYGYRVVPRED